VYIYGSYRKIKTVLLLFGPPCMLVSYGQNDVYIMAPVCRFKLKSFEFW